MVQVETAAAATVVQQRPAVIALVRPLEEGREVDPALRLRLEGRSA
jgi:hypothetical protein